jgi:hypothetical protein
MVDVAADGSFQARPSAFGVGSFDADLRVVAEMAFDGQAFSRETTLTDVRFWEDRDGQVPDAVTLDWSISPP